ncbi:hypothetical protein [Variovorax sp. J22R115]|uniref:hypothetical protein n=1 Tax=Variovorax sp. J22R115 TaxID=3053509 RepID=UPI002574D032|nr:hypothetical protein [Variovorax sp. J22R115]MDM0053357.1 hypothetical protein [Variovorax sp. J22R115]
MRELQLAAPKHYSRTYCCGMEVRIDRARRTGSSNWQPHDAEPPEPEPASKFKPRTTNVVMQSANFKTLLLVSALALAAFGCTAETDNSDEMDSAGTAHVEVDDGQDADPLTFMGYLSTGDCSGHERGYEWAEEKGIEDPDDCGGNSESFMEGCRAYAGEYGPEDDDGSSYQERLGRRSRS